MDKNKYKFVFEFAEQFLNKIINENKLSNSILERHLIHEKFSDIQNINRRLIRSLSNRNMMDSVIGFDKKEKEMRSILFEYNPNKILDNYKNSDELLEQFKLKFNLQNIQNKRSLWRKFSEGIISGSEFMASFADKDDFDRFIKTFSLNKYTKAALPMLLSKEIKGFGFALACDFLKEIGYRDYPKPDVMLIDIFHELGLSKSNEPYEVYKSIVEMSEVVGKDAYTVDKIFWLIGSGKLIGNKSIGRNRDEFIKLLKVKLENL
ncbi:MAG: hypothetical protein KGJ58_01975 [Patescibacteria group bacterium]|nr:hypothetical protein [Patescibacteria group bacterium]MDE1988098.1 hypothetical protein [Patescibacteria group bacterium]MDE2218203.1 hypothetical protein [Patescibacteria group bacterium]